MRIWLFEFLRDLVRCMNSVERNVNEERFAPIVLVARALRDYLLATYDVAVDGDRLVPASPTAAPLTIVISDFPQVKVLAGAAGNERFPQCGCDACDEDVEELAEMLERYVFSVVNGGFQETWRKRNMHVSWSDEHGGASWSLLRQEVDRDRLAALKARGKDAHWEPWSVPG